MSDRFQVIKSIEAYYCFEDVCLNGCSVQVRELNHPNKTNYLNKLNALNTLNGVNTKAVWQARVFYYV